MREGKKCWKIKEVIYLYLATGLRWVAHDHETHEVIEIHWLPFGPVLDWCRDGTITDVETLIGLFRTQALHGKAGRSESNRRRS